MKQFIYAAAGVAAGSLFGVVGAVVGGVGGLIIASIESTCRRCTLIADAQKIPPQMRYARAAAEKMDNENRAAIIKILNPDGRKWWADYKSSRERLEKLNAELGKAKRCKSCEHAGPISSAEQS